MSATAPTIVTRMAPAQAPVPALYTASTLASAPSQLQDSTTSTESASLDVPPQALCTRLQAGITKPKIYHDGTIRYEFFLSYEEPGDLKTALSDSN
jgi:hypothetical protein